MSDSRMHSFMTRLQGARSFEEAAGVLLDVLPEAAGPAPLLRAMVHLRPDDAYKGFFARAYGTGDGAGVDPTPSTTAWRWLEIQRRPVLLDVRAGVIVDIDGAVVDREQWPPAAGAFRSRERVLERRTSHILAFPMYRPGGRLDGFVSLELAVTGDMTPNIAEFADIWPGRVAQLDFLVSVAAPFLSTLPRAPGPDIHGDEWLPVVGQSMQGVMAMLEAFVPLDATLLLQGKTGVGKTWLARWCHKRSTRAEGPFESVNLSSESEKLREDLLFGHQKGAFTDARGMRIGLVTKANGGTLFIDEIDKLSLEGQTVLLSLLDDGSYRVLGDSETRHADVRFIVGTNIDLRQAVAEGRFREDLYYRIEVLPITLPPLCERRDEIAAWAQYFVTRLHAKKNKGHATLHAAAGAQLEGQPWPGNLRQLDSVMTRAYAFACVEAGGDDVEVRPAHVERALAQDRGATPGAALWRALDRAAHAFVDMAASRPGGLSVDHARALSDLILQYGIDRLGDKEACVALGKGGYLKGGNRNKLAIDKHVTALEAEIGPMNDRS